MKNYNLLVIIPVVLLLQAGCSIKSNPDSLENKNSASSDISDAMVLVPAGTFLMGSTSGDPDEKPAHNVYVDAFYIDTHEVTVRQYQRFLRETGHPKPDFWFPDLDRPTDPVVGVSWHDAAAYAAWAGKRLPAEAEWEYAARGGMLKSVYPWGDKPDTGYANFSSFGIAPVASFKPNGYGIYDMAGNVWEWCADWYASEYYNARAGKNPQGPVTGTHKVLRGGAWYCYEQQVRVANRYYALPDAKSYNVGFRCVKPTQ